MHRGASIKRTFLGKGLVERHPVAIGLCVDQHSITIKEQGFRPASCRGVQLAVMRLLRYRKASEHHANPHQSTFRKALTSEHRCLALHLSLKALRKHWCCEQLTRQLDVRSLCLITSVIVIRRKEEYCPSLDLKVQ